MLNRLELIDNQTQIKVPIQFMGLSNLTSECQAYDHSIENGQFKFQLPRYLDIIQGFELTLIDGQLEPDIKSISIQWMGKQIRLEKQGQTYLIPNGDYLKTWGLTLEYIIVIIEGHITPETTLNVIGKFTDRSKHITRSGDLCLPYDKLIKVFGF